MIIRINGKEVVLKRSIAKKQVPEVLRVQGATALRDIKIITGEFESVSKIFPAAKEHPDLQFVILIEDEVPIKTNAPDNCHIGVRIQSVNEVYKLASLVCCDAHIKFLCIHETVIDYLVQNQLNMKMTAIDWVEICKYSSLMVRKGSKTNRDDTLAVWAVNLPDIVCYVDFSDKVERRVKYVHGESSAGNNPIYGYESIEGLSGIVEYKNGNQKGDARL